MSSERYVQTFKDCPPSWATPDECADLMVAVRKREQGRDPDAVTRVQAEIAEKIAKRTRKP